MNPLSLTLFHGRRSRAEPYKCYSEEEEEGEEEGGGGVRGGGGGGGAKSATAGEGP